MKLKIETLITKDSRGFEANNSKVFNQLYGLSYSEDFIAKSFEVKEYSISSDERNLFQLLLSRVAEDFSKITTILAFCNLEIEKPIDERKPVKFDTVINDSVFLTASQFSLINCENISYEDIAWNNFQIPDGKKATFTFAISYK